MYHTNFISRLFCYYMYAFNLKMTLCLTRLMCMMQRSKVDILYV